MLKNITIGQYLNVDSWVHRLDPRAKLVLLNVYMILLFVADSMIAYIPVAVLVGLSIWLSKIPFAKIIRGLRPVLFILCFAFVLNIFMTKGEGAPLFQAGFLTVYAEGLRRASYMAIRLILLVVGTSILTLTTSPIQLTDGLEYLMKPLKVIGVPAHEIAMMMTIALRFIPTLLDETNKIMKAQMARGADFETGSILKRAKAMIPLLIPLFVSAFRRADELAVAMEARCYRGGKGRTRMKQLKFAGADFLAMFVFSAWMAGAVLIGKVWYV